MNLVGEKYNFAERRREEINPMFFEASKRKSDGGFYF